MIPRYTPLKRSGPPKKKRGKVRKGRLDAAGVQAQRIRIFERDRGICVDCGIQVIFNAPEEWDNSFHRAHIKNKRMYKDDDSNVKSSCGRCHRKYHQNGPSLEKPCPPKLPVKYSGAANFG